MLSNFDTCLIQLVPSIVPSGYPSGLHPTSVHDTSITLSWNKLPCKQENGPIIGYQCRLFLHSKLYSTDRIMGSESTTYTAKELSPHTEYDFDIAAINEKGVGDFSPPVTVQTAPTGKVCCSIQHMIQKVQLLLQVYGSIPVNNTYMYA